MTTPLDEDTLDRLVARASREQSPDAGLIGAVVDELRAHRIQTSAEGRLRSNHSAIMALVRSEALARGELDQALREITVTAAKVLRVGRVGVWRLREGQTKLRCEVLYRAAQDAHGPGVELTRDACGAHFEGLLRGEIVAAADARTDPRTVELADTYLEPWQIHALLDVPMRIDDQVVGLLRAEQLGAGRSWSSLDQQFAVALGDFTSLAIQSHRRRETEVELRETVAVAERRLQIIERQRLAIADLSAPILDVWEGVLAVPLVGLVDTQRSVELTERLLERISASGSRFVLVDLTGIDVVDTMTASHLLSMLRAARLLGAECVLGGISPQIAQTLVQLDVDLGEVTLVRSLKEGLELCLRRR